ncbi:PHA/PHB synthase family protein [Paraburkholderia graminis]|nr:alpha/beta fold hydrolase [Paraburkholderia graminis]
MARDGKNVVAAALSRNELDLAAHAAVAALTGGLSPASMMLAALDWALHIALSPGKGFDLAKQCALASCELAQRMQLAGTVDSRPVRALEDPRFSADSWSRWPYWLYRDAFLQIQQWWEAATTAIPGVERHHEELVRFFARQWLDACSPSNYIATNPAVQTAAWRSGGLSFAVGMQHVLEDLRELAGVPKNDRASPSHAWLPGKQVAVTPGKVVWRNALCELIQYAPATETVAREPLLIVPSWIMKYYILDLQPHNSLIRYLVDAGYTVYAMSWRNPPEAFRDVGLDDYLQDGFFAALAQVRLRHAHPVHAVGYCLGGTLLAMAAAALFRDGRGSELKTVTLLAAQTDFTEPGELGLFVDASELAALDALMWHQGYLDGRQMSSAFQLLNARDLIWSRMMSEYLLGRRSKPNDLMAWNADTTRLPYRMHSEYLTSLFLNNDLAEGRYRVDGRPVALSDIEAPMFVVGTERDHVSPWRSVYQLHLLTHNPVTFLLTAGGHNAGIVSEPGHAGRYYRCATRARGAPYRSRDNFLQTTPVDGSWWLCWNRWLRDQSSAEVAARAVDEGLCDAPGTYVFEK